MSRRKYSKAKQSKTKLVHKKPNQDKHNTITSNYTMDFNILLATRLRAEGFKQNFALK